MIVNFNDISNAKEVSKKTVFLLLLFSTLLSQFKMPYFNYGVHNVLIPLLALLIVVLSGNSVKAVIVYHRRTLLFIVLLYLWVWVSAYFSEFHDTAFKFSIKYSFYPLLFVSMLFLTFNNKNVNSYYKLIYYFLALLSFFGLIEAIYPELHIFRFERPLTTYLPRISSLMQNPNPFGSLMSLSVILVILFRNNGMISRVEFIICSILFIATAFLSGSRNAFIALTIGISVVLIYRYKATSLKHILINACIAVPLVTFLLLLYKAINSTKLNIIANHLLYGPTAARITLWKSAIQESIKHPIAGIGIEVFSKHIGPQVLGATGVNTHNIFLNIIVELGIVGLSLSLIIIYSLLNKTDFKRPLIVVPVMMFVASSLFDYFIYETTFMIIFIFFIALAANSKNEYFQKPYLAV